MGCSASRPTTFVDQPSSSNSSNSSSNSKTPNHHHHDHHDDDHHHHHSLKPIPKSLSFSSPLVHHPPSKKGDTHHLVSLTSSTYGSLLIHNPNPNPNFKPYDLPNQTPLSSHINFTKNTTKFDTLNSSFSSPDSVINTWELMEGLDDHENTHFDFRHKPNSTSSETFIGSLKSNEIIENSKPNSDSKPLWKHLSEESLLSKMDPNVASSYRRALSSRQLGFNQVRPITPMGSNYWCWLPGTEDRIVLYLTSLRGIRRTYEDCCAIRNILRGFRVFVDERDISMDSAYRKELQNVLKGKSVTLPQVFIKGKYIGGADEIKQLHENGELAKILDGIPVRDPTFVCGFCGDARFVPCLNCNGSRKVFEEDDGELRRCLNCNENGLIRCPTCCS